VAARRRPASRSSEGRRRRHRTVGASLDFANSEAVAVAMVSVVVTGQPRVARVHESRARGAGLRRPNPETRKVREQVCALRAARTRFARIAGASGRRFPTSQTPAAERLQASAEAARVLSSDRRNRSKPAARGGPIPASHTAASRLTGSRGWHGAGGRIPRRAATSRQRATWPLQRRSGDQMRLMDRSSSSGAAITPTGDSSAVPRIAVAGGRSRLHRIRRARRPPSVPDHDDARTGRR
jgi:hypothetical protein